MLTDNIKLKNMKIICKNQLMGQSSLIRLRWHDFYQIKDIKEL